MKHLITAILIGCTGAPPVKYAAPGLGDSAHDSARDSANDSRADSSTDSRPDSARDSGADSRDTAPDTGDTSWVLPPRPDTDHPGDVSWRWGGGEGYPDRVDPAWPVVARVADLAGLSAALAGASAGDIVYVEDDAEIDLTGQSLCIPGGVWLAGGRGGSGASGVAAGGLLYATAGASAAILTACGPDVRVTGLRIRGPDPENCPPEWPSACPQDVTGDVNCAYCTATAYGVSAIGQPGLEVDNNEFSGWTYAAVGVKDATGADIHHNHIHHGWREGLGYGAVLYGQQPTEALIRWNRFDAMRHVVAGQGYPLISYEARDNLVGDAAISHVFDMHGQDEADGSGSDAAGDTILIHRNIVLVPDQYSVAIRGRPTTGMWFYDNCAAPAESAGYTQRYFYGNFHIGEAPDGSSAPDAWGSDPGDCGTIRWCLADGAIGAVRYGSASGTPVSEMLVGDMDGDGQDEVFGTDGSRWRYADPEGGSWTALAASGVAPDRLALADLDGDGTDDVFYADGTTWKWSRSGTAAWATLKSSGYDRAEIAVGDFNGDGADDIFTADGSRWYYHPGGSGAPVALASSSDPLSSLAFGDFDGDGTTDVFHGTGSRWQWSQGGAASWADLAVSSATVSSLGFADVDGDGVTDVLSVSGHTLRWSSGGRQSWATLRHQQEGLADMLPGDFDGDGRDDILTGGCL